MRARTNIRYHILFNDGGCWLTRCLPACLPPSLVRSWYPQGQDDVCRAIFASDSRKEELVRLMAESALGLARRPRLRSPSSASQRLPRESVV